MASPLGIKQAMSFLTQAQQQVRDIRERVAAELRDWKQSDDYSQMYLDNRKKAITEEGVAELQAFSRRLDKAKAVLNAPALADTRPAAEQLLDEQRITRAWARAKELLEAGSPWGGVLRDAVDAGDLMMLMALRDELPTWVMTKNHPGSTHEERQLAGRAVARHLDIALVRALPDGPERLALQGRLTWQAWGPIVESELTWALSELTQTGAMTGLQNAINVSYLSQDAQSILDALASVS